MITFINNGLVLAALAACFTGASAQASEYDSRAALASEVRRSEYQQESSLRRAEHNAAMHARVQSFGARHGGVTITGTRSFDGATYGAGSYGMAEDILGQIDFTTGSGLACRSNFEYIVIECFDGRNQPQVFKVGWTANILERVRKMNVRSKR
jgi:hypothetical protein